MKYLGVTIGNVTEKDVFESAISNCFLRAQTIRDMDMTQAEKVQLLKACVYPLWILLAGVCYPTKQIVRQMCTMVHTALGVWDCLSLDILAVQVVSIFFCHTTSFSSIMLPCIYIFLGNPTTSPHCVWNHLSDGQTLWGCVGTQKTFADLTAGFGNLGFS